MVVGKSFQWKGFTVRAVPSAHERLDTDARGRHHYYDMFTFNTVLVCGIRGGGPPALRGRHPPGPAVRRALGDHSGERHPGHRHRHVRDQDARHRRAGHDPRLGLGRVSLRPPQARLVGAGPRALVGRDAPRPSARSWPGRAQARPTSPAIGLSGQMHGSVFLDADGQVIRPALLWNDQRTAAECAEIEEKAGGREALVRLVANPALTGFTAPKLLWVRKHEPQAWDRVRQVLLPKDYIRYRLTGTYATEVSDASGTLHARRGQPPLEQGAARQARDRPRAACPPATRAPRSRPRSAAWVRRRRAWPRGRRWSAAAATSRPGRSATASSGRASCRRRWGPPASSSRTPTELGFDPLGRLQRGCHAVPGRLARHGRRARGRRQLPVVPQRAGQGRGRGGPPARGSTPISSSPTRPRWPASGAEGLFFLPYLTGERTPHFDPDAKGAWIGLTVRHGRAAHDPERARRGDLRHARQPGADPRDGRRDRAGPRLGRRRAEPALAADPGRHLRPRRPHAQRRPKAPPSASPCSPRSARAASPPSPRRATPPSGWPNGPPLDPKAQAFYDRGYAIYRQLYQRPPRVVRRDQPAGEAVEAPEGVSAGLERDHGAALEDSHRRG